MKRFELHKVLIITGIAIVMTGLVLHWLTPENYGLYYSGLGLWSKTLMPALTYGMTFILIGMPTHELDSEVRSYQSQFCSCFRISASYSSYIIS